MFQKVLIANRGEIAVRIIQACRDLGIISVAVYSEADREALHAQIADEAVCIGPARAADSYLNMDNIISAALASGCQAIHPGFGFLSENPDFAERITQAGLAFIGLDLWVSQSSTLLPLHYQHDFRPYLAYLRTPPLPFRRRPPQSNCLPCTVPGQDDCPRLEPQTNQGGISRTPPPQLALWFHRLPPILHRSVQSPMQSYSKGSWGLSV